MHTTRWPTILAYVQGGFYVASGAWPFVSRGTFEAVTGIKEDFWLVQTVGLLLVLIGSVMILSGRASRLTREIMFLGGGAAFLLGCVDVYCVTQPRTTSAYLLDALIEFPIAAAWVAASFRARIGPGSSR